MQSVDDGTEEKDEKYDFTNHDNDDFESKIVSVEGEKEFKKHLGKMNREKDKMVAYSEANLDNIER